jgi:hypothetical protein
MERNQKLILQEDQHNWQMFRKNEQEKKSEAQSAIHYLPIKKSQAPNGFTIRFYQIVRKDMIPIVYTSRKQKRWEDVSTHWEVSITLILKKMLQEKSPFENYAPWETRNPSLCYLILPTFHCLHCRQKVLLLSKTSVLNHERTLSRSLTL